MEWNTLGVMGGLKGTLKNGDCQGSHLVIYIKFLDELRGTGGHYNKFYGGSNMRQVLDYRIV